MGIRIKQIRSKKGFTQGSFGKLLNASKSNVRKWVSGFTLPNKERMVNICMIADTTVNELLYGSVLEFAKENFENIIGLVAPDFVNTLSKVISRDEYLRFVKESKKYNNLSLDDIDFLLENNIESNTYTEEYNKIKNKHH